MMKWPTELILVRHGESTYNQLKQRRQADPSYQDFRQLFADNPHSDRTQQLAEQLRQRWKDQLGDEETALTAAGQAQARDLGRQLQTTMPLPEIVYVSPYLRTIETLHHMTQAWPELAHVRIIEEERIREQEFGLRLLYGDWRVMMALHPEQFDLFRLQGAYWYRQPQGENIADVRERNRSWMNTLTRDFAGKRILAVTHHITILAIRANMERLSARQFLALDRQHEPKNCSLTVYRGEPNEGDNGRLVLERYNEVVS